MKILSIKKGWFRSAGHMYKWVASGYHIFGVGVDMKWLRSSDENIIVEVQGNQYVLNVKEAKSFLEKFQSYHRAGRTTLGVVSLTILKPVRPPDPQLFAEEKRSEVTNAKLF